MDAATFNDLAENRLLHCRLTLLDKGEEYSRDGDRLHNFKSAGHMNNEVPSRSLWGMASKHLVCVQDMVKDADKGLYPPPGQFDKIITDSINYFLLLEGVLTEAMAVRAEEERTADFLVKPHTCDHQYQQPVPVAMPLDEPLGPSASTLPAPGLMTEIMMDQVEDLGFHVDRNRRRGRDD